MVSAIPVRLSDYRPWLFVMPKIRLDVEISPSDVFVTSRLELEPRLGAESLQLRGVDLEICSLKLDGEDLASDAYSYVCLLYTSPSPRD